MENNLKTEQRLFSERLAKLRIARGVSARLMSFELGQNKNYITNIENCRSYPSFPAFINICNYLNVSPQDFFTYDDFQVMENNDLLDKLSKCSEEQRNIINKLLDELK